MAQLSSIPKEAVTKRLEIMFHRDYHPFLYDRLMERFRKAGMPIHPTETFSAPSEMQYFVKTRGCFGLIHAHMNLDPELAALPIEGFSMKFLTAVVSHETQQRPAIPVLAYRLAQRCSEEDVVNQAQRKSPQSASSSVTEAAFRNA